MPGPQGGARTDRRWRSTLKGANNSALAATSRRSRASDCRPAVRSTGPGRVPSTGRTFSWSRHPMPFRHLNRIMSAAALAVLVADRRRRRRWRRRCSPRPPPVLPRFRWRRRATVRAVRASQPIRLDGRFDEAAWAGGGGGHGLRAARPRTWGSPARERTEVRVLYDDGAVYVAARMLDPQPESMQAPLARRDAGGAPTPSGSTSCFDSYHDSAPPSASG